MKTLRHAAARADEIPPGGRKLLVIAGVEIGLFRLPDGSYRAYQDYCPHAGAPLCNGEILFPPSADAAAAGGGATPPVLRCPWHGWEFDLATGAHVRLRSCRLDAYPVECQAGTVFVCLPEPEPT